MITLDLVNNLPVKIAAVKAASRAALKTGAAAGAQVLQEEEKSLVPVLTGNLRDHIHTETLVDSETSQILAVTPTVASDNKYGFEPPYARRIEYGFMGTDSLGRQYHQAAQPYVRPALDNVGESAQQAIKDAVVEAIEGVA